MSIQEMQMCECVIETTYDETDSLDKRVPISVNIIQSCQAHSCETDPWKLSEILTTEYQDKKRIAKYLIETYPNVNFYPRFSEHRELVFSVDLKRAEDRSRLENELQTKFPQRKINIEEIDELIVPSIEAIDRKKPIGQLGSLDIHIKDGTSIYVECETPNEKENIERWVLNSALRTAISRSINLYNLVDKVIQNSQNDFDFTLPTSNGTEYLELMECAMFPDSQGYKNLPTGYNMGELCTKVFEDLMGKSKKYMESQTPLHLLIYSTDWRLILTGSAINLLIKKVERTTHVFASIWYVVPEEDGVIAELRRIHPPNQNVEEIDEEILQSSFLLFADLKTPISQQDGSVKIPTPLKSPLDKRKK